MAGPSCHNCIYSVCDAEAWLRLMSLGEPILPTCANHPQWPAQLHEVPGVPCKNYRRKPPAPQGDVRLIPLTGGHYAYVDAADYEWLNRWTWHVNSSGYAARTSKGRTIYMHRQIMQPPKGKVVDHHDGNVANNCRCNLRVCNHNENRRSGPKPRGTRSGFKGVYYRQGRICAQLRFEGRLRWFGFFPDEVTAAQAYDRAAVEAYGEFARPNFPEEWPPERRRRVHAQYLRTGELSIIRKRTRSRGRPPSARRTPKSSSARNRKKIKTKERKKNTRKTRRGESSFARKPHPPRRKTKRLPQRSPRTQRQRNHR